MIKYTYIAIALLICSFAFGQKEQTSKRENNSFSIEKDDGPTFTKKTDNVFVIGNVENGVDKTVYLTYFIDGRLEVIDSCLVKKNGKFELSAENIEPDFYRVSFTSDNFALLILSKGQKVILTGDANNFNTSYSVKGSFESEQIKKYVIGLSEYKDSLSAINKLRSDVNVSPEQRKNLATKQEQMKTQLNILKHDYINKNYNNLSVLITMSSLDDIKDYNLFKKIEKGLSESSPNSKYYASVKTKVEQIDKKIKEQDELKKKNASSQPGKLAPELNFPGLDGKVITLASLRGKYVLIDFWASWCGPCRKENPNVVRAYNKYKEAGFTVFSVSLDRDKNRWEQAIIKDGLIWPNHVSDLKAWQSAAVTKYGFRGIPHTVLIDKEGRILQKNLRGQTLENKLEEIFGF